MNKNNKDWKEEKPLGKITCTSYDCDNKLHSFRTNRPKKDETYRSEKCRACGASLIDWDRIDKKDLTDINHTLNSLRMELWRHEYWCKRLDEKAIEHAKKVGMNGLKERIENRLWTTLKKPKSENPWDGRQTPLNGNIIYYAQHAVAACCRGCVEEWWSIKKDAEIKEKDIKYLAELVLSYIKSRLPDLPPEGSGSRQRRIGRSER